MIGNLRKMFEEKILEGSKKGIFQCRKNDSTYRFHYDLRFIIMVPLVDSLASSVRLYS